MSSIRRQSIFSTLIIYAGFLVGLLNIYLFTKQGLFTKEEFGLYNVFIAIALLMAAVANLGAPYFIYKFFPYYQQHLPEKKNDQLTVALVIAGVGFLLLLAAGHWMEPLVIRKFSQNAPSLVHYYKWIYPLGAGLLLFNVLEAWSWQHGMSTTSNFLKEALWRIFVFLLIGAFMAGWIRDYDLFIKLFSFSYPFIAGVLLWWLVVQKKITLTVKWSTVSKRFRRPIAGYTRFTYVGTLIFTLAQVFDSILISSVLENAMAQVAVYSFAQNMAAIIQAPQRGIAAASMSPLSKAWKEKDTFTIGRIYQRSSINQLLFAFGLFGLILLNFTDAITTFRLESSYINGLFVFLLLGLTRLVDMGTGVNSQIIVTSPGWRFEFYSGIILLLSMLPLSYFLTKEYGIVGTAIAQLMSIFLYNIIRILFLFFKYRLQPFSRHTASAILLACCSILLVRFLFMEQSGWISLFTRSLLFIFLYITGVWTMRLSPDLEPVWKSLLNRIRKG